MYVFNCIYVFDNLHLYWYCVVLLFCLICLVYVLFVFVLCTFCLSSSCVRFVCSFSGLSILISPSVFSNVYFHCFGDRSRDVYGIEKQYCNLNKQLQKWFNYVYPLEIDTHTCSNVILFLLWCMWTSEIKIKTEKWAFKMTHWHLSK
jgi:hypothetical protein